MSAWPSTRARRVLAALLRIGWVVKRQSGSHRTLSRTGWADFVFAFHDDDEIGPRMLARIAKRTGLQSEDLEGYQRTPRSSGRASRAAHRARSTDMRSERGGT
jgi:predicted RNA binding protein YcfA (HicA-like mRNA interferase family)